MCIFCRYRCCCFWLPSKKNCRWEFVGSIESHSLWFQNSHLSCTALRERQKNLPSATSFRLQVSCEPAGNALWSADVTLGVSAQAQTAWVQAHHIPHIVGDRWSVLHQGGGGGCVFSFLWDRSRKSFFKCKNAHVLKQRCAEVCDCISGKMNRSECRGCSCARDTTKVWGYK